MELSAKYHTYHP